MTVPYITTSWHSYPRLYAMGHNAVTDIFEDEVTIEEKVDGSQFSFGKFNGELKIRSKGVEMNIHAPEKMFNKAAATVLELADKLQEGWTYRAEYLQKPKHNTLAYERTPNMHLIVFDVNTGDETYLSYEDKKIECDRLGLEVVPLLFKGRVNNHQFILELMDRVSVLGLQKIEGVVVKNYTRFGLDRKALMAKHVSEAFKEVHHRDWDERNPGPSDIIDQITLRLRTPARWEKAVQHLKEQGKLTNTPKDIGALMKEIVSDTLAEEQGWITEKLHSWAMDKVKRGLNRGVPEWYKNRLLESQFENKESND